MAQNTVGMLLVEASEMIITKPIVTGTPKYDIETIKLSM